MPSEETRQAVTGLKIVQGVFQAAALAALIALGGGGTTKTTGKLLGKGADVTIHTGVDLKPTEEVRTIVLDAFHRCRDRIVNLMTQTGTKVPKLTGFLRSQFQFSIEPDGSAVHLSWPVFYAEYLWDQFAPGYISVSGKKRHGEDTFPNWSQWAIDLVTPIVLEALRGAFEAAGYRVEMS